MPQISDSIPTGETVDLLLDGGGCPFGGGPTTRIDLYACLGVIYTKH